MFLYMLKAENMKHAVNENHEFGRLGGGHPKKQKQLESIL